MLSTEWLAYLYLVYPHEKTHIFLLSFRKKMPDEHLINGIFFVSIPILIELVIYSAFKFCMCVIALICRYSWLFDSIQKKMFITYNSMISFSFCSVRLWKTKNWFTFHSFGLILKLCIHFYIKQWQEKM